MSRKSDRGDHRAQFKRNLDKLWVIATAAADAIEQRLLFAKEEGGAGY